MAELKMPHPHPKQLEFFNAITRYVCYGGARGGGKTFSIIWKAILFALNYPGIKMLIVRKTYADLAESFLLPMQELFHDIKDIQYRDSFKSFFFENGSRIKLGYCSSDADLGQYQSAQFDIVFFEEATQFTEYQFRIINAACRGTNPNFPRRTYLTCNPGDVGHEWVKRLFIDKKYKRKEKARDYTFIQAKVTDNPTLMINDPQYIENLEALPDGKRQAWLDGDWSVFAGQYFSEFDENIHVIEPFPIPAHWKKYFTIDYGLDMCAGLWIAQDEKGNSYAYRELHKPDLIISEAARQIREMDGGESVRIRYAPPDLWNRKSESGKSTVDQFNDFGLYFDKSSNSRIPGWLAVKEHLKVETLPDGKKTAKLKIFKNCPNLIYCLPNLIYDKDQSGDVSDEPHNITHAPDALRGYCVMYSEATKPIVVQFPKSPFKFTPASSGPSPIGYGDKIIPV